MDEDQYELGSGVKRDDLSPYLSAKDGPWGATIIDSSVLDTPAPMKVTKIQKSIMYNPQVGSYMNEMKDVNIEHNDNADVSNRAFSKNYGTYTTKLNPEREKVKTNWKTVSSVKDEGMNVCTSTFCMCPICKNPATQVCNCEKRDSMCRNGHIWHIENGKIVLGNSHKQVLQNGSEGCVVM